MSKCRSVDFNCVDRTFCSSWVVLHRKYLLIERQILIGYLAIYKAITNTSDTEICIFNLRGASIYLVFLDSMMRNVYCIYLEDTLPWSLSGDNCLR